MPGETALAGAARVARVTQGHGLGGRLQDGDGHRGAATARGGRLQDGDGHRVAATARGGRVQDGDGHRVAATARGGRVQDGNGYRGVRREATAKVASEGSPRERLPLGGGVSLVEAHGKSSGPLGHPTGHRVPVESALCSRVLAQRRQKKPGPGDRRVPLSGPR